MWGSERFGCSRFADELGRNWVSNRNVIQKQTAYCSLPDSRTMIIRTLKKILPASLLILIGCSDDKPPASVAPKLVGFSLRWVHPKLPASEPVRIDDSATAMRLASVFEEYYLPLKGTPYDCPMYDVVVTLHRADGTFTDLKVYLPRTRVFLGMWKHPDGPLNYFEVEKSQQKVLVDILRPYTPASPVYPPTMTSLPPVEFNRGIPDFREVDYQISGDFSPSEFVRGGQR